MSYNPKTQMYEGYIYLIYNDINQHQYIGQTTKTLESRFSEHKSASRSLKYKYKMAITKAINKYGERHFYIKELQKITDTDLNSLHDKLNKSEKEYIIKYNTLVPNGYNLKEGGNSVSDICKKQVDQYTCEGVFLKTYNSLVHASECMGMQNDTSNIGECCKGRINTAYGYIWRFHGEPFDKYIINKNPYNKMIVDQYDMNGKYITSFSSASDAAIFLGKFNHKYKKGQSSKISNCCHGLCRQAYGYVWRFKGDPFDKYSIKPKQKHSVINQYDINNIYITTFYSITEAADKCNCNAASITTVCKGRRNMTKGFKWFYADDPNQPDKTKIIREADASFLVG